VRFSVEPWDPSHGAALEVEDLGESTARVDAGVELPPARWHPLDPEPGAAAPAAVLFVDGVRRVDAHVWVHDPGEPTAAAPALCASYAAGVVRCDGDGARLVAHDVRRGLFTAAAHAVDVTTPAGTYAAQHAARRPEVPAGQALGQAVQARLAAVEIAVATAARDGGDDLLVVDGPLRGRQHLARALGYVKSHRSSYLPAGIGDVVAALAAGQRTPVFQVGTSWDRYSWYLRLPGPPGAPWAGVVRLECAPAAGPGAAVAAARLSQVTLGRYASTAYKDARAPQNLYPIAGLERALRRRLGDPAVLHRALRVAAAR